MDAEIQKLLSKPAITVDEYRRLVPGGRNSTYEAIARKEIEVLRQGKRIFVLTAPLRVKLGIQAA